MAIQIICLGAIKVAKKSYSFYYYSKFRGFEFLSDSIIGMWGYSSISLLALYFNGLVLKLFEKCQGEFCMPAIIYFL